MVAHRPSTIQHADKIIVKHKGEIRQSSSHQELLKLDGLYKKLYDLQLVEAQHLRNRLEITCASDLTKFPQSSLSSVAIAYGNLVCVICISYFATILYLNRIARYSFFPRSCWIKCFISASTVSLFPHFLILSLFSCSMRRCSLIRMSYLFARPQHFWQIFSVPFTSISSVSFTAATIDTAHATAKLISISIRLIGKIQIHKIAVKITDSENVTRI